MARPARSESARLFVALDLPEAARAAVVEWQAGVLAGRGDLRPVAPEALHATLAFVGHRPAAEVGPVGDAVVAAVAGLPAARLRVAGVAPVPPRRPRLFALDLVDVGGGAGKVQAAVSDALAGGGWYEPERRPFWPHVTFARVRRGERAAPVAAASGLPGEAFRASEVTLYWSHLHPRGARYEAVVSARLG